MSVNKCFKCDRYYTYPKKFYKEVSAQCEYNTYYKAIIECECGQQIGVGGEDDGELGINMFTYDIQHNENSILPKYKADMLVETDDKDSEFATIEPDISQEIKYLERKNERVSMEKKIICKLLDLVSAYQKDGILKEAIIDTRVNKNNEIVITKLMTKGDVNKGTPFYSGNMSTMIVDEYYIDGDVVYAEILYSENKEININAE